MFNTIRRPGLLGLAVLIAWQLPGCGKKEQQQTPPATAPTVMKTPPVPATQATSAPVTEAALPATSSLDLGDGMKLELVLVPAGSFMMGSPDTEQGHDDSESPVHKVTIGKPFYIGKFEVTQAQFVKMTSPKKFGIPGDDRPCEEIGWAEAKWFCDNASAKTGKKVRLPSEAEWEYAARAGTTTPFWFGVEAKLTDANFGQFVGGPAETSTEKTVRVGTFKPNPWGLYDTVGNVGEWCQDNMHDNYKGAPVDGSAWETPGVPSRVYRGGAYSNDAESCRSAYRGASAEPNDDRNTQKGFRVVVEAK